jgi:(p)ppGpp synthase/HD superfamily hydrolase
LALAAQLHATQLRKDASDGKGPVVPYVAHLLEVAALVWIGGGNEDQAIAGLLHDALEDQSDKITADDIEKRFGASVRDIVEACSDGEPGGVRTRENWLERKQAYLERLELEREDALLVSVADKVSNARATVDDLNARYDVWKIYKADPSNVAWYYQSVLRVAEDRLAGNTLTRQLSPLVARIAAEASHVDPVNT